ncbi:hypothetical protein [Cognataquiflexum aquatile]|uniref:hypothetical protein n=1 Tax=Cognataquiflexum aquatile TaxID=2249427 RepID=UPI000DE93B19|nr:hypothetical protein [Cognataquiflexum aquatile]
MDFLILYIAEYFNRIFLKMDKKAFTIQSFEEAADLQKHYDVLPEEEKENLFFKLMQEAYGIVGNDWPKMDKSHFDIIPLKFHCNLSRHP